jgi:hypothetical protein
MARDLGVSSRQVQRGVLKLNEKVIKTLTKRTSAGALYAWKAVIDLDPQHLDLTEELQSVYEQIKNRTIN